jgi:hypothetical protein
VCEAEEEGEGEGVRPHPKLHPLPPLPYITASSMLSSAAAERRSISRCSAVHLLLYTPSTEACTLVPCSRCSWGAAWAAGGAAAAAATSWAWQEGSKKLHRMLSGQMICIQAIAGGVA